MGDEREIIASIRRCLDGDSIGDGIIKKLKECARTDESTFINTIQFLTASGGHIQVKFLVPTCTLKAYYDFFVDNEGLGDAIVYARKKHECLEEPNMNYIYKESAAYSSDDIFKKTCESFARIGVTKVEESDINNEKDFEYICDRCGVRVTTPNTIRGPVNVVDFYREVEDEFGDSVSYRLCPECMQDFFGFLSCN